LALGLTAFHQLPEFPAQRHRAGFAIFRVLRSQPDNVAVYIFPEKRSNLTLAPAGKVPEPREVVEVAGQLASERMEISIVEKALPGISLL